MTWDGHSKRGAVTQTTRWRKLRATVLDRDAGRCYICGKTGADAVDHIVPASRGGSDELTNLAAVHDDPCHRQKTAREGHDAAAEARAKAKHPVETHPGLRRRKPIAQ